MKIKNLAFPLLFSAAVLVLVAGCKKGEQVPEINPPGASGIVTDVDGNVYKTIQIGTQIWMAENLQTTRLNDGSLIPLVADQSAWNQLTSPGHCFYNNDASYKIPYGAYYNGYAVKTGILAPEGWHVPTVDDWYILFDYLGGSSIAGGKLKEAGTSHWQSPNEKATNESGFTALPGGWRENHSFVYFGSAAMWWSSISQGENELPQLYYGHGGAYMILANSLEKGHPVRCLKNSDAVITDIDGNQYKTTIIGTQTWMAENLRTTKYRNGTPVQKVSDSTEWGSLTTGPAYCVYNTSTDSITYGVLYNWRAASDAICPEGWHLPSDEEWATLAAFLGATSVGGGKLKETGTAHWQSPNTGASNETDFTALPGGYRSQNSSIRDIGKLGAFWSSTQNTASFAWIRYMEYNTGSLERGSNLKGDGLSIRCVKD